MFVYIVGWQLIEQTAWYKGFIWHFNSFTETISIQFIKWFERDISPKSKLVEYSVNLTMPINSYKLYFISFIMLTLITVRQYKYLLLFIF